jgi:uncharacterized membrane protein YbhN (UPF0104 family)
MKKALLTISKIVVAVSVLGLVFYHVDPKQIWSYVKGIHPLQLLLAVVLISMAQMAGAIRMRFILEQSGVHINKRYAIKLGYLGGFFNFLLPGGVGGDAIKIYFLKKNTEHGFLFLLRQLLADRASGLYFLCLLAFALLVWIQPYLIWEWLRYVLLIGIIFVTAGYFLSTKLLLKQTYTASVKAIPYSLFVQMFWVGAVVTLWASIGDGTHGVEYVLLYALAGIASTIPISVGGLGLREMTFLFGAQFLNTHAGLSINEELGVAISLALYTATVFSVLPGAIFWKEIKNHKVVDKLPMNSQKLHP